MIAILFYFTIFIIIGLIAFGFLMKQPGAVMVAGVFTIMVGVMFLTGGTLELSQPATILMQDLNTDATLSTISYTTLNTTTSNLMLMMRDLFLYGGFALLIISLGMTIFERRGGGRGQVITEEGIEM